MPAGRPTSMTDITVKKLDEAFLMGCTDQEACLYANITKTTLYEYCKKHPEYTDRKETLKKNPVLKARKALLEGLKDKNQAIRQANAKYIIDKEDGKAKQALDVNIDGKLTVNRIKKNFDGE